MSTDDRAQPTSGVTQAKAAKSESFNPRDTDHPTGSKQAAENAANDPPS